MNRRTLGIVALAVVVVLAATGGSLWVFGRLSFLNSYGSQYDYSVRVSASEPVSNVTLLVPLPVSDGDTPLRDVVASRDFMLPDGWAYDVAETEYGPMLRIRADELPADPTYYRAVYEGDRLVRWEEISADEYAANDTEAIRVDHDTVELSMDRTMNRSIDTRDPVGTEPVFEPRANAVRVPCDWRDEDSVCYRYDTRVFLRYDGPETATVSVTVELRGTNSWWVGGWNYNEYRDGVYAYDLPADRQGWVVVAGELETGSGNYPRNPPQ